MPGLSTKKLRTLFLEDLTDEEITRLKFDWPLWARLKQRPPLSDWRTWLMLGGRGSGKTRTGAEWLKGVALADPHYPGSSGGRVALVGANYDDMRNVMVEGESGLLAISRKPERPQWFSSRRELVWPNGVIGRLFSSADPEGLRGDQFGAAWCDETCKWSRPDETWDMLQFCLRLGDFPRQVVTTMPKPMRLLKRLMEDAKTVVVRMATRENEQNLADGFLDLVEDKYAGTRLGRQELGGELVEANENALWSHDQLAACRVAEPPELVRIVIAVDPPAGSGACAASCGIVAVGIDHEGHYYLLADATVQGAKPNQWAARVASLFHQLDADLVVAEVNQGGEMVKTVLHTEDPVLPVRAVHARKSKWLRAEPVAMLYERKLVHHVGEFRELEDQMCAIGPDGTAEGVSPDRVDALVWAISELTRGTQRSPRIRRT